MWPNNGKLVLPGIAVLLLLSVLSLVGCADVSIVDKEPTLSTPDALTNPAPSGDGTHNLAVLAVDFDPPLTYQQLVIRPQSVELLVAVENTGKVTERDVTVRAQLSTPQNPDGLLTQGASLASIAPGEIQIVHFARLSEIPFHETYILEVVVEPVPGETDLTDNTRAFELQIHRK
jgi:hypothetical protein